MSCCDPNGLRGVFTGPVVAGELRDFKRRGPSKRQRVFLEMLQGHENGAVLDIGCGVGALGLSLLAQGAVHSTFVDVSKDYLQAARDLAEERNVNEQAEFLEADFLHTDLSPADSVMLDRVVCCYPDAPALLRKAAAHSQTRLVFSYPRPTWWMRLTKRLLNLGMRVWRKSYRFYVHEEAALLAAAESNGHALKEKRSVGVWHIAILER